MRKMLINVILSFLLTGCYPCAFLDWNCNHIQDTIWYKRFEKCDNEQTFLAQKKLGNKFNKEIQTYIINRCSNNYNHKFLEWNSDDIVVNDPWYKASLLCKKKQQKQAEKILKEKYNSDIYIYISNQCFSTYGKYEFILDQKFSIQK